MQEKGDEFYANIPQFYIHDYAQFVVDVLPNEPKWDKVVIEQLVIMNRQKVCDLSGFMTLTSRATARCEAELGEIISAYLENCRDFMQISNEFVDRAMQVAEKHDEILNLWLSLVVL